MGIRGASPEHRGRNGTGRGYFDHILAWIRSLCAEDKRSSGPSAPYNVRGTNAPVLPTPQGEGTQEHVLWAQPNLRLWCPKSGALSPGVSWVPARLPAHFLGLRCDSFTRAAAPVSSGWLHTEIPEHRVRALGLIAPAPSPFCIIYLRQGLT